MVSRNGRRASSPSRRLAMGTASKPADTIAFRHVFWSMRGHSTYLANTAFYVESVWSHRFQARSAPSQQQRQAISAKQLLPGMRIRQGGAQRQQRERERQAGGDWQHRDGAHLRSCSTHS